MSDLPVPPPPPSFLKHFLQGESLHLYCPGASVNCPASSLSTHSTGIRLLFYMNPCRFGIVSNCYASLFSSSKQRCWKRSRFDCKHADVLLHRHGSFVQRTPDRSVRLEVCAGGSVGHQVQRKAEGGEAVAHSNAVWRRVELQGEELKIWQENSVPSCWSRNQSSQIRALKTWKRSFREAALQRKPLLPGCPPPPPPPPPPSPYVPTQADHQGLLNPQCLEWGNQDPHQGLTYDTCGTLSCSASSRPCTAYNCGIRVDVDGCPLSQIDGATNRDTGALYRGSKMLGAVCLWGASQ